MRKFSTWQIVGVALIIWDKVLRPLIGSLGDVDTVCNIASLPASRCGSGSMIHSIFAANWWGTVLTLVGVGLFLYGERRVAERRFKDWSNDNTPKIDAARNSVESLTSKFDALLQGFNDLVERLDPLAKSVGTVEQKHGLYRAREYLDSIRRPMPTHKMPDRPTKAYSRSKELESILQLSGISQNELDEQFSPTASAMMGDAKYVSLTDQEHAIWQSQDQKRDWHIHDALLGRLSTMIENRISELRGV